MGHTNDTSTLRTALARWDGEGGAPSATPADQRTRLNQDVDHGIAMHPLGPGLLEVHRNWGWYLALGVFLVMVGCCAIAAPMFASLEGTLVFGWLLIASGLAQLLGAAGSRRLGGYFLNLLGGVFAFVVGVMTLRHPGAMDLALTMLIATYLLVVGIFRVLGAVGTRFYGWGLALAGGLLSLALGAYIYATLPIAKFWVIGTFIGVEILSHGWTWIFLALAMRDRPASIHER